MEQVKSRSTDFTQRLRRSRFDAGSVPVTLPAPKINPAHPLIRNPVIYRIFDIKFQPCSELGIQN